MNEREATLKQWVVNQIKDTYGDFERLLAAKYDELVAILNSRIDNIEA